MNGGGVAENSRAEAVAEVAPDIVSVRESCRNRCDGDGVSTDRFLATFRILAGSDGDSVFEASWEARVRKMTSLFAWYFLASATSWISSGRGDRALRLSLSKSFATCALGAVVGDADFYVVAD